MSLARRRRGAVLALAALVTAAGAAAYAGVPSTGAAERSPAPGAKELFRLRDDRISESSGLAVSARHRGLVWTHNDSGDLGRLFAVSATGRTLATYTLRGVQERDWEALAPGRDSAGRPALFVADIGDNREVRDRGILVHRVSEPASLRDGSLPATSFRLRYPDRPHDAEALLVHPLTGRLYVVTKDFLGGAFYLAPARLRTDAPNILTRVGPAPRVVTDGAFLPDGRVVLRNYRRVYLLASPGGDVVADAALPEQEQGESLAVDGRRLLVGSEGRGSPVYAVPVPSATGSASASAGSPGSPTAAPSARTGPGGAVAGERPQPSPHPLRLALASLAVVAAAAGLLRRRHRHRH